MLKLNENTNRFPSYFADKLNYCSEFDLCSKDIVNPLKERKMFVIYKNSQEDILIHGYCNKIFPFYKTGNLYLVWPFYKGSLLHYLDDLEQSNRAKIIREKGKKFDINKNCFNKYSFKIVLKNGLVSKGRIITPDELDKYFLGTNRVHFNAIC